MRTTEQDLAEIQSLIRKHQSISQGNSIPEQVALIIQEYQRSAENATSANAQFRDRLMTDFRALELILNSALNSETHKEKDAHLRILSKLLGSAIERLRDSHFQSVWGSQFHFNSDPFQCDWPVREMKKRIYELEDKLRAKESEVGA